MRMTPLIRRFALVCICVVLAADSLGQERTKSEAQTVAKQFNAAFRREDWKRAIEIGLKLDGLLPDNPMCQYNLACAYARSGDADHAAEWLEKAAVSGFSQVWLLEHDSDLVSVREHAGYLAALEVAKGNLEQVHVELKKKFEKRRPNVYKPPHHDKTKPAPLIIALHGYGGRATGYPTYWRQTAAKAEALLATPQGVYPVAGAGFSWLPPNSFSTEDADYLVQLTIEYVKQRYAVDERRIVLTGFSQGGWRGVHRGRAASGDFLRRCRDGRRL